MKKAYLFLLAFLLLLSCNDNVPNITELEIVNLPEKVIFNIDEQINFEGLIVQLNYDNGASNIINNYEIIYDELVIGQNLITINYKSFSDSFEITVLDNAHIVELRINKLPDKLDYYVGDEIDLTGLKIEAILSNGEKIIIDNYEVKYEKINDYLTEVIIDYEKSVSFEIIFQEKVKLEIKEHQDYASKTTKNIMFNDYYQIITDVKYAVYRDKDMIIVYDEDEFISTNEYGYEVAVDKTGRVVEKNKKVSLPEGGFIISGHSAGATKVKSIEINDYVIFKDTQLFVYRNENIIKYNDVFYLFYAYLDYVAELDNIDEYNKYVEKLNNLIPTLDQFYVEYSDDLKNQLIEQLSNVPDIIEPEYNFQYSYCENNFTELEFIVPDNNNYIVSGTYEEKLYIGGFRNTNTLVYYDKDCYLARNISVKRSNVVFDNIVRELVEKIFALICYFFIQLCKVFWENNRVFLKIFGIVVIDCVSLE